jgi:hypothetical protein
MDDLDLDSYLSDDHKDQQRYKGEWYQRDEFLVGDDEIVTDSDVDLLDIVEEKLNDNSIEKRIAAIKLKIKKLKAKLAALRKKQNKKRKVIDDED